MTHEILLQRYNELKPADKVRAVLSAAQEPISRKKVFLYGGIFDVLSINEQEEVDQIFETAIVDIKNREDEELFQLTNQELELTLIGDHIISEYFLSLWSRRKGN